jgi:hypothetical protein
VPAVDELDDWGGDGLLDNGVEPDAARKRKGSLSLQDLMKGGSRDGSKERHEKKRKEGMGGMVRENRGSGLSSGVKGGGMVVGAGARARMMMKGDLEALGYHRWARLRGNHHHRRPTF